MAIIVDMMVEWQGCSKVKISCSNYQKKKK